MEAVLSDRGSALDLQRARRLDPPPTARAAAQAVAARTDHLPRASCTRNGSPSCRLGRRERTTMVGLLIDADPLRATEHALRRARDPEARRVTSTDRTARCGPACRVVWQ